MPLPELHCTFCGHSFGQTTGWPRQCASCKRVSFRNPIPVAVLLLPVVSGQALTEVGLLVIRRDIPPAKGELALPGGYVDDGEDWRAAASRELVEEAGITLPGGAASVRVYDVRSNPEGDRLLVFGIAPAIDERLLPPFTATGETSERRVINAPQPLAFPLHTEVAARFFADVHASRLGFG